VLYELWRQTAADCKNEVALVDLKLGRSWTFSQLAGEADQLPEPSREIVFVSGSGSQFILQLLQCWRWKRIACPLEPGQAPPTVSTLPPGTVHLKVTSATSGPPKIIAFAPSQLLADVRNIASTMGLRRDWPNLGTISLAHSYGFSNLVLPLLLLGIPLILLPAPFPELLRQAIMGWNAVTIAAVPALWRTWFDAAVLSPKIQLAISAGAPLPLSLEQQVYQNCGIKIRNFYGSSECGGIAYDRSSQPRSESNLAGNALENVQLSLSPEGLLIVQSEAVALGYLPPDASIQDGSFYSSDLAELRGGNVYLQGRIGDLINVAGRKVAPELIESVLRQHPAVEECVVFGVPDAEERTEKIVACLSTKRDITEKELKLALSEHLPGWQIPRQFWFTHLQVNARGKVSRAEWKRLFLEEQSRGRPTTS
jgi:long-chain acyl-CoA synthetase